MSDIGRKGGEARGGRDNAETRSGSTLHDGEGAGSGPRLLLWIQPMPSWPLPDIQGPVRFMDGQPRDGGVEANYWKDMRLRPVPQTAFRRHLRRVSGLTTCHCPHLSLTPSPEVLPGP